MKTVICSAIALGLPLACLAKDRHGDWPVRDQEAIQKTFLLKQEPMRLVVDNVEGYIHVVGVSGSEVRVTAHKTIHAETEADLAQARSDVTLSLTEKPGTVTVYYDAPWRCQGEERGCHGDQHRFYSVAYDLDIEVPYAARLFVSAVNNGDVRVEKTSGDFEVKDINGGIDMSAVAGSGSVHTINGPVKVHFAKNPTGMSSFKSINGQLDVWFQPELSADLLFKTFNGQVYSAFEIAPRAVRASGSTERRDGKFVYRSHGVSGGRAGKGGPELDFDTLNGSIRLHLEQ